MSKVLWSRIRSWFFFALWDDSWETCWAKHLWTAWILIIIMNYSVQIIHLLVHLKWAWPADLHLICASDDVLHRLSGCVMTKYKEFSYIGELSGVHLFVQCSLLAHAHFPSPPIDQQPHLKLREAESVFLSGGCRGWTVIADSSGTPNGSSASCYRLCLCVMVSYVLHTVSWRCSAGLW